MGGSISKISILENGPILPSLEVGRGPGEGMRREHGMEGEARERKNPDPRSEGRHDLWFAPGAANPRYAAEYYDTVYKSN